MIPEIPTLCHSDRPSLSWQAELQRIITDPAELLQVLELPDDLLPAARRVSQLFPLKAPRPFVSRIHPRDMHDPLLRQILPLEIEEASVPGFITDPLGEQQANPCQGLLHKYQGRVLLIATGTCAVHCRYCFRRHFPYQDNNPGRAGWQSSLNYIAADASIHEVILSGGDPLILNDALLGWFLEQLSAIPHVKIVRFHTRLPIVIPERITPALLQMLMSTRLTVIMILHCNHAQEIDQAVITACTQLKRAGMTVLNQAVLLRGVNDQVKILTDLSYQLIAMGVLPYYLHVCDRVAGAAHFFVPETTAMALHEQLLHQLPGYLLPRLVREEAGAASKIPL